MDKDLFSEYNYIMRPMQIMEIKPSSMIFPNMKLDLVEIMPMNFSQNSKITTMYPPKMGAIPRIVPSLPIFSSNSNYSTENKI